MTEQDQRIALAEFDGWTNVHFVKHETFSSDSGQVTGLIGKSPDKQAWPELCIPDYLHDLNAVHELEKKLTPAQQHTYIDELYGIIIGTFSPNKTWLESNLSGVRMLAFAAAHQRCEALLRTINKWKD